VLRYKTHQIRENFQTECLRGLEASINKLGRLLSDVPRSTHFLHQGQQFCAAVQLV
jgi:hypothetical protein